MWVIFVVCLRLNILVRYITYFYSHMRECILLFNFMPLLFNKQQCWGAHDDADGWRSILLHLFMDSNLGRLYTFYVCVDVGERREAHIFLIHTSTTNTHTHTLAIGALLYTYHYFPFLCQQLGNKRQMISIHLMREHIVSLSSPGHTHTHSVLQQQQQRKKIWKINRRG